MTTTGSTKAQILQAVQELPDDTTWDEALERLQFVALVKQRIAELDAGVGVSDEEARRRLARWLT